MSMGEPADVDRLEEIAEGRNCQLVTGEGCTILLDLDRYSGDRAGIEKWRADHQEILNVVDEKFDITRTVWWASRNGHLHISIEIGNALPPPHLIGLQLALGSDPLREVLGIWEDWRDDIDAARALFRPKGGEVHTVNLRGLGMFAPGSEVLF